MDIVTGLASGLPSRHLQRARDRALRRRGALRPRPHQRLPAARPRAVPDGHRPRHDRAGRPRARGSGRTSRSRPRSRRPAPCRWSTSRSRSTGASSSTAASARPRTSTSRSSTARSSSSSSTRSSPTSTTSASGSRRSRAPGPAASPTWASPRSATRPSALLSHDRLHRAVEHWEQRYPGVDIILIEPELDDELMFGTSILDYCARLEIAKHGFESVTLKLARDYERYKSIAERHGIEISARRVRHVLDQVERERRARSRPGAGCWSRRPRLLAAASRGGRAEAAERGRSEAGASPRTAPRSRGVLLGDDVALHLQRRRQLAALLREVVRAGSRTSSPARRGRTSRSPSRCAPRSPRGPASFEARASGSLGQAVLARRTSRPPRGRA